MSRPGARALMRLHAAALFTHDDRGRIVRVNEPGGPEAPRFFLGRTAEGSEWRFRHDLDDERRRALEAACRREPLGDELLAPPHGAEVYEQILGGPATLPHTSTGPAYYAPDDLRLPAAPEAVAITRENVEALLRPRLPEWVGDVARGGPILAAVAGGEAVAVCASVRITGDAHEAGVETVPEFRGRGHGMRAVAAWAAAVRALGAVPLYSTSWSNVASRALARKLGLARFGADLHIR